MSTQRSVPQRGNWRRTVADVEEIARLLNAGGRLLRKSGALLRQQPSKPSRRGSSSQCGGRSGQQQRRMDRKQGKKQQTPAEIEEEKQETGSSISDGKPQGSVKSKGGCVAGREEEEVEKLIPGIPDDVTLNHILTKLGWAKLVTLASVSPAWHQTIAEGEVYRARLRYSATQTFLAIVHRAHILFKPGVDPSREIPYRDFVSRFYEDSDYVPPQHHLAISLYNPSAESWHLLPPIPQVNCGIPHMSACVSVAGKLYVLGGEGQRNMRCTPRNTVFMMDLASGQHGVWKECARMNFGRSDFACGVIDGKVYVAGGWSHLDHVWVEAEVFDPDKNSWQRIMDMPVPRLNYTVGVLDKQLYVIGGSIFHSISEDDSDDNKSDDEEADWADAYDPRDNKWRRMEKIGSEHKAQTWVVMNNDKLCSLHSDCIDVYDKGSHSWSLLMPNSWEVLESTGAIFCSACSAISVDGGVFAFVRWLKGWPYELTLLEANNVAGRGMEASVSNKLPSPAWKIVKSPFEFNRDFFFLVPVHL